MAAAIKSLLVFVIFSSVLLGFCQGETGATPPPCLPKLLPCQPFLASDNAPPASCCVPLKDLVANDAKCLCQVFENAEMLKGLNVTREDALNLAKTCGANADSTLCKTAATPTLSPIVPTTNSTSSTNTTASAPAEESGANVMSHFGGSILSIAFLLGLLMFSF